MKARARPPAMPPGTDALESNDGEWFVLSFPLDDGQGAELTPAESEVAALVLGGRTNGEIAALRRTSVRTVANQVASAFRKLGVRSRLEMVALAPLLGPAASPKK